MVALGVPSCSLSEAGPFFVKQPVATPEPRHADEVVVYNLNLVDGQDIVGVIQRPTYITALMTYRNIPGFEQTVATPNKVSM